MKTKKNNTTGAKKKMGTPQDLLDLLSRLGRGGTWQNLLWKDGEEKGTVWFPAGEVPDISEYLKKEALFFGVNPRKENLGPYKRGGNQDVDVINAVYADLDINKGWTRERIDRLVPEPSGIVFTGGGWQAYWFLKEPIEVTKDNWKDLNDFQHAWVEYIGGDGGAQDIARALRVPHSFNNKPEHGKPIPVEVVKANYDLEYSVIYLESLVCIKADRTAKQESAAVDITIDPALRERVIEAMQYLDQSRADAYKTWLPIAMALHDGFRGSNDGYQILDEWSRNGKNYDPDENWRKWQGGFRLQGRHKITIKTLFFLAREDSNGRYNGYASGNLLIEEGALTDSGNAKRLAELYGDQMRYNKSLGWVIWDDKKWNIDDSPRAINYAEEAVKSIFAEAASIADSSVRAKVLKHANQSLNLNRLKGMLGVAESKLYAHKNTFDDNHKWLLNVKNGILNLKTRELLPHDPKYFMTKMAGTHYDPNAKMPKIAAFIEMIFPDPEVRRYVQKAAGYSLTGNSDERAIYFLEGKAGNNGKSTWINLLRELFGEYATAVDIEVILATGQKASSPMNEMFYNARFVSTSELPAGMVFNTTKIKSITGNDPLTVNPKFRDPYEFLPTHHLWIFGNNRPQTDQGDDDAFWGRMKRIVFDHPIPAEIRRPMEEVMAEFKNELPGFLNWLLEGLAAYLEEGWKMPERILRDVQSYQEENDFLGQFIENGYVLEANARMQKKMFLDEFNRFLVTMQEKEIKMTKLTQSLEKKGVAVGGRGGQYYLGLRPKTPDEFATEQKPVIGEAV